MAYINFDGTNIGEAVQMFYRDPNNDIAGKNVPVTYRKNATKGADLAVSSDGMEVTVATLHPACNILLHKGYYAGDIWEDDFFDGLSNGSVIALFDTTNSEFGTNIPNNDPKPYTEVQVNYDEHKNLHVVYDATYFDVWLDTSRTVPWASRWNTYSAIAGDTNGVFYDGSKHPKPQLRYWNSITKTHSLLSECTYPLSGETYKWYNHGIYDSSAATWGKYINDGPIANIELLTNKNPQDGEPKLICVWEEMQGDVMALADIDKSLFAHTYTYYAYMKDIKISVSDDGSTWSAPYNITNTPDKDEGEVSVYRDVIDNKIHLVYSEDSFPGNDSNLRFVDEYADKYLEDWPFIEGHFSVPIRKEITEQVQIIYREFDLSEIPTNINTKNILPGEFNLAQNYPNPFNNRTMINYQLPETGIVNLVIYNILGQKIRTLVNAKMPAGAHQSIWDGTNEIGHSVSSGIYLYKLKTETGVKIKKMLLQK